jgi:KipI family sensor histidine kinase inhibitor
MYRQPRFLPAGDRALCVELGDVISPEINHRVRSLFLAVEQQSISGIMDVVPAYRSILVYYDPMRIAPSELEAQLRALNDRLESVVVESPKVVAVPTVYGGEYGPDLEYVARYSGLSTEEVVRIHSGTDYLVYMMGFTPGFTYLGGMSERIATPRLQTPRVAIPAGSVGITEQQTGVYPIESPGGWQLIGRTPIRIFDPDRDPPVAVEPGDYMRFVPVSESEYMDFQRRAPPE